MKPSDLFIIIVVALLALAVVVTLAMAADPSEKGDPIRGKWFRSLVQPGSGISCCSAADCNPTEAKQLANGQWQAIVRGVWRDIPPEKVLKTPKTIDGLAYVCASENGPPATATIWCLVPPAPGY